MLQLSVCRIKDVDWNQKEFCSSSSCICRNMQLQCHHDWMGSYDCTEKTLHGLSDSLHKNDLPLFICINMKRNQQWWGQRSHVPELSADERRFIHTPAFQSSCTSLIASLWQSYTVFFMWTCSGLFHSFIFFVSTHTHTHSHTDSFSTHLLSHQGWDTDSPSDPSIPPPFLGEAVSSAQRHLAHLVGPGAPANGHSHVPPGFPHPSPASLPCPPAIHTPPCCQSVGRPPLSSLT